MVILTVLNLFLYNALKIYIHWQYGVLIDAILETAGHWSQFSFWQSIPVVSRVIEYLLSYEDSIQAINNAFWAFNPYVNALLLLPSLFQNDLFYLLLVVIVMWNCYVCIRTLSFSIVLTYKLWWSQLCWGYYVLLIGFDILMNGIHFILIVGTVKLRQVQTLQTR